MLVLLVGAGLVSAGLTLALANALALSVTQPLLAGLILILFAVNSALLTFSALLALAGLRRAPPAGPETGRTARAPGRCAVLWLTCGEPPEPLAARIDAFIKARDASGQGESCDVFVLSDTSGERALAAERAALAPLMHHLTWRHRALPEGRKPGNLQDWIARHGHDYEAFLLLDADSGFCAERLARMRARMAAEPGLGLIQAGIRLRPARSRLAAMQRLSARLAGPVFTRGLARLSGDAGNFWGHNALIRTRAFAQVTPLPDLPGAAPLGGPVLSHDIIEAAHLRRAGWAVAIEPDSRGSFEDAPENVATHMRRDRRWAQGNLQHLRLLAAPGLHPVSRLHLLAGILTYLSAPFWLFLVLLTGSGAVHATMGAVWPLMGVLALLLVPKLAGLAARGRALGHPWRRRVLLRALGRELGMTTLFAPLGMIARSGFVASVLAGRCAGWVPSGQAAAMAGASTMTRRAFPMAGAGIVLAVALPQAAIAGPGPMALAAVLLLPVCLPLLAAPALRRWFDAPAPRRAPRSSGAVARYYDASTRRFLAMGGSGAALAIHRPLWAEGVRNPAEAAAHVNALILAEAEAVLGKPPARVTDLGCGVGGTLMHLAQAWPQAQLTGITISAEQQRIAQGHAAARGLAGRCRFLRSDFLLPSTLPRADLVIAVESHVHAPDAASFLRAAMGHLRPGGVLVLVDDMLARPETDLTSAQARRLSQFRRGWRLGHVPDPDGLVAEARAMGLSPLASRDLSGLLRLNRLRDGALSIAGPLADALGLGRLPLFGNKIGGNALTQSYRHGQMRYMLMVLRRDSGMLKAAPPMEPGINTPPTQEAVA